MRARIDSLSDGQKACLRLVHGHLSSKEIARKLGISRHTADQRIALACQKLGVTSRRDAAILFGQYDPFIYERSHIALQSEVQPFSPEVSNEAEWETEAAEAGLSDVQQPEGVRIVEIPPASLPFPRRKGDRNDLSIVARLSWALVIFAMAILVSGALIAALEVLGRIL